MHFFPELFASSLISHLFFANLTPLFLHPSLLPNTGSASNSFFSSGPSFDKSLFKSGMAGTITEAITHFRGGGIPDAVMWVLVVLYTRTPQNIPFAKYST